MAPKTDEEISQEIEEVEFKKVETRDAGPELSQDGCVMGHPVYQPVNTDLQPIPMQAPIISQPAQPLNYPQQYIAEGMPCNEPAVNAVPTQNEKFHIIRRSGRFALWMTFLDFLTMPQLIMGGWTFLLALAILPLMGYYGVIRLSRPLTVAYMMSIVLIVELRIAVMFIENYIVFYIVSSVVILVEIIVLRYQFVFYKLLGTITGDERKQLLEIIKQEMAERNNGGCEG